MLIMYSNLYEFTIKLHVFKLIWYMCACTNNNEVSTVCIQDLNMYVTILELVGVPSP
jgi:hypothetical protein